MLLGKRPRWIVRFSISTAVPSVKSSASSRRWRMTWNDSCFIPVARFRTAPLTHAWRLKSLNQDMRNISSYSRNVKPAAECRTATCHSTGHSGRVFNVASGQSKGIHASQARIRRREACLRPSARDCKRTRSNPLWRVLMLGNLHQGLLRPVKMSELAMEPPPRGSCANYRVLLEEIVKGLTAYTP